MPDLKFLAPTLPEIWKGSKNFKSRSGDSFPTPIDLILHFLLVSLGSICLPNLKFLAQTVPEIWRGSENSKKVTWPLTGYFCFSSAPQYHWHNVVPVNKVKLRNQQHVLFCRFAIKETNFVLNCNSSFIAIFYSRRRHCKYDWLEFVWIWLAASTQSGKCDWRRLDKIWLAAAAWWPRLRGLCAEKTVSINSLSKLHHSAKKPGVPSRFHPADSPGSCRWKVR